MRSMLDQDFYTLTVGQAVVECFPEAIVTYEFKDRNGTKYTNKFMNHFLDSLNAVQTLKLADPEYDYLGESAPFLKPHYREYVRNYRFNTNEVQPSLNDGALRIGVGGYWHRTIYWEVPLLGLVSDAYFKTIDVDWTDDGQLELAHRISDEFYKHKIMFADGGTRRRRNYEAQDRMVGVFKDNPYFVGTSNVHLAHKHGTKPKGTQSHQWIMGHAALESLRYANRYALKNWNKVYNGDLGIALPDTYGTSAFFEDFDKQYARLFDGVRHDSGDPYAFADRVVAHYKSLRIDHSTKTVVFSNSVTMDLAIQLGKYCQNLGIKSSFIIGGFFTNNYGPKSPSLNIVIKLRSVRKNHNTPEIQVVKLSDDLEKGTGDPTAQRVAKWTFFGTPI